MLSYKIYCNKSLIVSSFKKIEVTSLWQFLWQVSIGMGLLVSVDIENIGDIYAKFVHLGSCVCYIQSIPLLNAADSFHVSCKTPFAFWVHFFAALASIIFVCRSLNLSYFSWKLEIYPRMSFFINESWCTTQFFKNVSIYR